MPIITLTSSMPAAKNKCFKQWSLLTLITALSSTALACQLPQSYYKNVSCTSSSRYFLAVKDSGLPVALLNTEGNSVADLTRYTQVDTGKLQNGVMPVQRSGKVGYIDMQGREVVPIIYDMLADDPQTSGWARAASSNRIIVRKNRQFGIINTNNQIIVPFSAQYRSISDFDNGVAEIQKSSGRSWIATNGRAVQNPNALIPQPNTTPSSTSQPAIATSTNLHSSESLPSSIYRNEIWQPVKRDGKWGFVNSNNVPMIRFSFDEVTPFSEGLAGVRVNNNWGFIDLRGELVIPFRFDENGVIRDNIKARDNLVDSKSIDDSLDPNNVPPFVFVEGKAWIGNLNDGTKLCIDKDGTNVTCNISQMPSASSDTQVTTTRTVIEDTSPVVANEVDNIVDNIEDGSDILDVDLTQPLLSAPTPNINLQSIQSTQTHEPLNEVKTAHNVLSHEESSLMQTDSSITTTILSIKPVEGE